MAWGVTLVLYPMHGELHLHTHFPLPRTLLGPQYCMLPAAGSFFASTDFWIISFDDPLQMHELPAWLLLCFQWEQAPFSPEDGENKWIIICGSKGSWLDRSSLRMYMAHLKIDLLHSHGLVQLHVGLESEPFPWILCGRQYVVLCPHSGIWHNMKSK